ncbi:MAG: asparagine synthase (glutamine-hydrolyzing) [Hyphomicrobiaceae bacterium]
MCGIVGTAGFTAPGLIGRMCDLIRHRGPDSDGVAEVPAAAMAIGMRRLAIIDVGGGNQPFVSDDRGVHLVHNGEIYNFEAVRADLEQLGRRFKTRSDTEVALQAYLQWGHEAWPRLHGMFAIALIDTRGATPALHVIRDRLGIKPLYYSVANGRMAFASEIKALTLWPGHSQDVDADAIADYLALRYVPGPRSLLKSVMKLPAGHRMTWSHGKLDLERWWSPPGVAALEPAMSFADGVERFGSALSVAVKSHMIADVPVGAFLSGGIDSNVIVALMAKLSPHPVHTFSIGFPDFPDHDRDRAAITAKALSTKHTPIECRPADMANLADIAWHLDEPVGDAIVVPMYVLAREARKDVTVVLSGEGADEILGGYMFHRKLAQIERIRSVLPGMTWPLAAAVAGRMPTALLDRLFDYPGRLGADGRTKVANMLASIGRDSLGELYRSAVSLFDPGDMRAAAANATLRDRARHPSVPSMFRDGTALQRLVSAQYDDWLPDDILMKADKMTMAHSLEGRVPYMDAGVVQAAASIPDAHKLGADTNKKVLRTFAERLLPKEITTAPKQAFYLPLESYLDTPALKDLMARTLDPERTRRRGLFAPAWIAAQRDATANAGFLPWKRLFSIIMLELWLERFAPDASWA